MMNARPSMTDSTTMTDTRRLCHSELYCRWGPTTATPASGTSRAMWPKLPVRGGRRADARDVGDCRQRRWVLPLVAKKSHGASSANVRLLASREAVERWLHSVFLT